MIVYSSTNQDSIKHFKPINLVTSEEIQDLENTVNKNRVTPKDKSVIIETTGATTEIRVNVKSGSDNALKLDAENGLYVVSSGGTTNYEQLSNKPQINSIELIGNRTLDELNIQPKGDYTTKSETTALENDLNKISDDVDKINEKVFPLTLSVSGGGTFKKGITQTITVRWTVKQGDEITIPDTIEVNNESVTNTDTSKVFNDVTTNTTYSVEVTKNSVTKNASTTATFVNPTYIDVVNNDFVPNESNIISLTEVIKATKAYTANGLNLNNQKVLYAYPKSFGALSSIKDGNGFENLGSYTRSEDTINGELYYIYILSNAATINNLKQIYS